MELVNIRGLVLDLLQELEDHIGARGASLAVLSVSYRILASNRARQVALAPAVLAQAVCIPEEGHPSPRVSRRSAGERYAVLAIVT